MDNILALYIILGIILAIYIILRFSLTISYHANSATDEVKISVKWIFFPIYPKKDKPEKTNNKSKKKPKKAKSDIAEEETLDLSQVEKEFVDITEDELDDRIESLEKELESKEQSLAQSSEAELSDKKTNTEKINKKADNKKFDIKNRTKKSKKDKDKEQGLKAKINDAKDSWNKFKDFVPMTWKAFRKLLKKVRFYDTQIEITAGKDDAYDAAMNYGGMNTLLFNGLGIIGTIFSLYKPKRAEVKCVFDEKIFEYELSGKIKLRVSTVLAIVFCFGVKFLCVFLRKRHKAKKHIKLRRKLMLNKQKELLTNEG